MVDYQILSIVLTGIGMIIALTYYALQIRNQNRTRQAQLLMNLYEVYRSPEFRARVNTVLLQEWTDPDDFWERYGLDNKNGEAWTNWQSVAGFFHGIGFLPFLDVADHPQQRVVPQSPVELSVAGYLPLPLGHQCFEDSPRASGWSAWAFLVVCFLDGFFDVV